ncbi:MAG: hypothetical protein IPK93_06535 [Solirubrobacterales bacterium]|nr:hypothetical protein [Solirubrobacterales bacterium]
MNSLLKMKRLPGILALALVALAVGAAGVPASASTGTDSGAQVSGLSKKQKKSKKKALKKCKKKRSAKKKKSCKKQVKKKYKKLAKSAPAIGKTVKVSLGDNFFSPAAVNLKLNDAVEWSWANIGGREPHNVTLTTFPSGVNRNAYISELTAEKSTRFKRQFTKVGEYDFVCSIHFEMTMKVNVSK